MEICNVAKSGIRMHMRRKSVSRKEQHEVCWEEGKHDMRWHGNKVDAIVQRRHARIG